MGKNKNIEEHNRLLKIAFNLFIEKGYSKTSFQDIAEMANVQKALVQYYFPHKEVFINLFLSQSLDVISDFIKNSDLEIGNEINNLYLIGYFEFWYLINDKNMEFLKYDIVSSRQNTQKVIAMVVNWALKYINLENEKEAREITDAITISMGGAFEYVYMCLTTSRAVCPKYIVEKIVLVMNTMLGFSTASTHICEFFEDEWLIEKTTELNKIIFE
ncbi:MAG: TetR/AcrR family transcriptional regulator [Oscillospiraceae bacterium]